MVGSGAGGGAKDCEMNALLYWLVNENAKYLYTIENNVHNYKLNTRGSLFVVFLLLSFTPRTKALLLQLF